MPPDFTLTDEDRAAISAAWVSVAWGNGIPTSQSLQKSAELTYLAGIRAGYRRGIEDAAKCCDELPWPTRDEDPYPTPADCAAAIRALAE